MNTHDLLTISQLTQTTPQQRAAMSADDANYYIGLLVESEMPSNRNFETEAEQDAHNARFAELANSWPVIK